MPLLDRRGVNVRLNRELAKISFSTWSRGLDYRKDIVNCRTPCRGSGGSGAAIRRWLLPSKHSLVSFITITDGIVTPGPFGIDDDWRYMPRRAPPLFDPTKKLRKGIDLVIMATVWESKQLSFEDIMAKTRCRMCES